MRVLADTHTHTSCSTHAFGTVWENIRAAKEKGLEMICMTDHAPALPDSPHLWHFITMFELPDTIDGVRILKGAEANILDGEGNLDLPLEMQKKMEVLIASIHSPCYPQRTIEENTKTWLNVIKNPNVMILGHSGNPSYPYLHEPVIAAAKDAGKCVEINNHSFWVRGECYENCKNIALTCKKMGTNIVVSSDAHNPFQVGVFDDAIAILKEIDFPEELIMNLNAERFENYTKNFREGRI